MCMQVAVRKAMRDVVPDDVGISTYEPMDMRHCAGGRTETIRYMCSTGCSGCYSAHLLTSPALPELSLKSPVVSCR